ncbi:Nucleoside triphosphate pyrophosphohydrolase [Methyloligella halotolerans]|uniref:Nucleoside triphosphate pyrophosphohydrolase n=1 Tax=Methyloligella halotolerans TaxID=1177755 RepID=A0A1E2S1W4_9HYPH|nr:nucleoside triphosphate pyrophosphohydrolase [Methyloligella halotolerans]ODA68434.1 Nucleoside triphosphate pyrophosphohydrolase [Methyloligella halotolerans]
MANETEFGKDADGRYTLDALLAIMRRLRDPETGCPWDAKQDFSSIAPYTVEEAYEVADAIARDDRAALKDELGDLLFQVVYHAQMADEEGAFAFDDVVDAIAAKMVRRHPHVFDDPSLRDSFLGSGRWDEIKAQEKEARGEQGAPSSLLDDVPLPLPALSRAVKLQKRAARVGFDWPEMAPVFDKAEEEFGELKEAIQSGDQAHVEEEFGDLLFVMANLSRHLKIDPEAALRGANEKFRRRFQAIEQALMADGKPMEDATLKEMDALWDAAKRKEKAGG